MTNKELQMLLGGYPDDLPIKLMFDHTTYSRKKSNVIEFTDENIILSSETAYVDTEAPEDEWDTEDGKVELGNGQQYLLLNPIIL